MKQRCFNYASLPRSCCENKVDPGWRLTLCTLVKNVAKLESSCQSYHPNQVAFCQKIEIPQSDKGKLA